MFKKPNDDEMKNISFEEFKQELLQYSPIIEENVQDLDRETETRSMPYFEEAVKIKSQTIDFDEFKQEYFGMKGEIREDGLLYLENGRVIDLRQTIE